MPAVDAVNHETVWFDSKDPNCESLKIVDLLQATSAAPTFWPMHTMEINNEQRQFVDGGVTTNNPSFDILTTCR